MSKIPREFPRSVFFLFSKEDGEPLGTGFIVERSAGLFTKSHFYAVSNFHAVKDRPKASIIRLNNPDLSSRFLRLAPDDWTHIPFGDDLVVVDITEEFDEGNPEIAAIHESSFLRKADLDRLGIGLGENTFMIGLLAHNGGKLHNVPAARFGNLTQLANGQNLIEQPTGYKREAHLVDMKSRTGFSGSPVFAYRTQMDHLDRVLSGHEGMHFSANRSYDSFVKLLGVHCGQLHEPLTGKDQLNNPYTFSLPSSVTVVIPAWRISEILDQPIMKIARENRERDWQSKDIP